MSTLARLGQVSTLLVSLVGGFEGLRQHAYPDTNGIATICYGETQGVKFGDYKTKAECDAMFGVRLKEFQDHVEACVTEPMPDEVRHAFTSLAYNIGWQRFCKSSAVNLYNDGDSVGACDAMLVYVKDRRGHVLPGLQRRRQIERDLCMKGVV